MKYASWILIMSAIFGGCNKSDEQKMVTSTIGATGGKVVSNDGKLSIDVPPGALAKDTVITVTKEESNQPGYLGPIYQLGPEGQAFAYPVKLVFSYEGADLQGYNAEDLWVATELQGQWLPLTSSGVDDGTKTVSAETPHFSKYAVIFKKAIDVLASWGKPGQSSCLCDTDIYTECCNSSGPFNPALLNSWVVEASPTRCSCANANWYNLDECYENKAGYEIGGCTKCERDCCKEAGGYTLADNGACYCSEPAQTCLDECKTNLQDLTTCELSRSKLDVALSELDSEDHKLFSQLLEHILQGKDPSSCAPALDAYLKGYDTLDLSQCTLTTMLLTSCALAIAQNECPTVCQESCPALGGTNVDAGPVVDSSLDAGPSGDSSTVDSSGACGGTGEPCCSGDVCNDYRTQCTDGTCSACGGLEAPCCSTGTPCNDVDPGANCVDGICHRCGRENLICCAVGKECPDYSCLSCQSGTCQLDNTLPGCEGL